MTPYYADDWLTVHQGDCREVMAAMEPESVHCVVTSPPYWRLRGELSPDVRSGLACFADDGRFDRIDRCSDHQSCRARVEADDGTWALADLTEATR